MQTTDTSFGADTIVQVYNATEARMSALDPATVMGVPFFTWSRSA